MKEIGAIFVVSISEIRTVQLAAIKRRYNSLCRSIHIINSVVKLNYTPSPLPPFHTHTHTHRRSTALS